MQLGAEVAEVQRGVPAAVARIGQRQRHVVAEEGGVGDPPTALAAREHEQSLA